MQSQATKITSLFGSRLSSAYETLRGDLGAPQNATDTIDKLVERIQSSPAVEDRRTAVLGLKGLSRDWKADVGSRAMGSLVAVLQHDAPFDTEIAKATLETLMQLSETAEKPTKDDLGLRFTDAFLEAPQPLHCVLALLSNSPSFYPRFYALQYLSQLLTARPTLAQSYIMSSPPPGVDGILSVLDSRAPPPGGVSATPGSSMGGGASEMLRNEALLLLPAMLAGNPDLQKIVAFSGAFEKLFEIVSSEGGADGGIVVQDALTVVGCLLRFNVSNQNYFRELSLIPQIPPILGFPSTLGPEDQSPDEFALQFWPEQKIYNAGLALGLVRMLVGGPGGNNQSAMVSGGVTRCLLELALASNAPNGLKSQALNTLTPILTSSVPNQTLLSTLMLAPLIPIRADEEHPNGGFVRLPLRPAVLALVQAVIEGDPSAGGRGLRGRAAGVNMFEAYVTGNDDARIGILSSMISPPTDNPNEQFPDQPQSAGSVILSGLLDLPPSSVFDPYRPLFACLLLAHLVRNSEHAKKLARDLTMPTGDADSAVADDDEKVTLVQLVVGNLMMAAREHTECVNRVARQGAVPDSTEEEDWTRVMVGYLVLLCTWLWDSPKTVKEFLSESANLQVLIQPITQANGIDPLVQGLSAFLLGVCYEFNREPGEITRSTLHPILHSRIGPDQFVSRMARLREDPRFRAVQPDAFDAEPTDAYHLPSLAPEDDEVDEGLELWFDWAFVDFWKNHYYTIQRSIAVDPDAVRGSAAPDDGETAAIIMSLRQKLKVQTEEVVQLQSKLSLLVNEHKAEKETLISEVESLSEQVATLSRSLESSEGEKSGHNEKLSLLEKELAEQRDKLASSSEDINALADVRAELSRVKAEHEELLSAHEERGRDLDDIRKSSSDEIDRLKKRVTELESQLTQAEKEKEKSKSSKKGKGGGGGGDEVKIKELENLLKEEKSKREEGEKEHEDLLVLLDELSGKRKKDKERLKTAGLEVSEGEEEEEDGDGDGDEEDVD
ncbi:p115 like vesicle tethering protein [Naematelia encephala]|uniref:p115 like vesicle tethering protein n=1 Tax=Naematelia encephala TaxID=71784 RepID=A0A1Y2AVB1_9TREE|nr:p115 like vesicle tethering protein [Naematelia encephala]